MSEEDDFIGYKRGSLTVLCFTGRRSNSHKLYAIQCSVCKEDYELFGEATYYLTKSDFMKGKIPCGCSKSPHWTEEQAKIRINRFCEGKHYTFYSFVGEYKGVKTKLKMFCEKHKHYWEPIFPNLQRCKGCPLCKAEKTSETFRKPDADMIASFVSTGAFAEGTEFWRSARLNKRGYSSYWHVKCPDCPLIYEAYSGELQKGNRPCSCPVFGFDKSKDSHVYVLRISNPEGSIKFTGYGISNRLEDRIKDHIRNLNKEGLSIEGITTFEISGSIAFEIERLVKSNFELFRQDISGFKREATLYEHYDAVAKLIQVYILT